MKKMICSECLLNDGDQEATMLLATDQGDLFSYLPYCNDCGEGVTPAEREPQVILIKEAQVEEFPFSVGKKGTGGDEPMRIARFASPTDASEFIGLLRREDPEGVDNGDYYIDGPELFFAVQPMERHGQPGFGLFDQDQIPYGWWQHRRNAEAAAIDMNKAVQEQQEQEQE